MLDVTKKFYVVLGLISILTAGIISGCSDYDNPAVKAQEAALSYYVAESAGESPVLEPDLLKKWIDQGYVTDLGEPVVIINVDGSIPAKSIKGAVMMPQNDYFTQVRSDGPMDVGNMVADGATMDKAIRYAGIKKNTVVVITGAQLSTNNIQRVWWTFYYWGFSTHNVKVLNGANFYFNATYPDYMVTSVIEPPAPSAFSVKELPGYLINRMTTARADIGEVISDVKFKNYVPNATGNKILLPTMNPSTPVFIGANEVTRIANASPFGGRIMGATQVSVATSGAPYVAPDGRYKTADEIRAAITAYEGGAQILPTTLPANKRIIVHCGGGQSTAPHYFVIAHILGYKNTAIYDGSWSEWGNLNVYTAADNTKTFVRQTTPASILPENNTSYLTFDWTVKLYKDALSGLHLLDNVTNLRFTGKSKNMKFDTTQYTDFVTFPYAGTTPTVSTGTVFDATYNGAGNEIVTTDTKYQKNEGTANNGGGPITGGGAPSGC